jgi:hypothetical protein
MASMEVQVRRDSRSGRSIRRCGDAPGRRAEATCRAPIKLNLKPEIEREMEELLSISGSPSKTAYINEAVRERNERLRHERQIAALSGYFARRRDELRAVNRELRSAARRLHTE